MFKKLYNLFAEHKDIVVYLFFGVLTTVVSYGVYFPLYNLTQISALICNGISWVVAVAFAFVTNKIFVFHSTQWSMSVLRMELIKFVGSRLGSLLLESGIIFVTVDLMCVDGNLMKILTGIVVIIFNYVTSKMLVFKPEE